MSSDFLADFLSFRLLISPAVLLVFYYLGAVAVPLAIYYYFQKASKAVDQTPLSAHKGYLKETLQQSATVQKYKGRIITFSVIAFIFLELLWRMLFEFLIAYYQMHNALIKISG